MGKKNSDAQNNQKCGDSFKHQRILRNGPIKGSTFLHSQREFYGLPKFDPILRIFSNGAVAGRQPNFGSCFGTTHFDLRRPQRGFSLVYRGWRWDFIAINF
jgi:hypothetical protein